MKKKNCFLLLENGVKFKAKSYGYIKNFHGEIVFNTSNLGYQEVITDPSYLNQIIVFTSANIGNTGINLYDNESFRIWLGAIVVKNISVFFSNKFCIGSLYKILKKNRVIILEINETRDLIFEIKKLKKNNFASIYYKKNKPKKIIKNCLLKYSSTRKFFSWNESENYFKKNYFNFNFNYKIIIIDCGFKFNLARCISKLNIFSLIINYNVKLKNIYKLKPDGIIISNGPGNPTIYSNLIKKIQILIKNKIPIFGICFGHQIISLSCKNSVKKMKTGHHGINHPVYFCGKILVTTQNHDFFVEMKKNKIYSLFDNTNQGLISFKKKILSFQGHPEGSPGIILFKIFKIFINIINVK